jgi:hypothetical protein
VSIGRKSRNRCAVWLACPVALLAAAGAHAQVTSSASTSALASPSGWSFNITPYIWLPRLSADLQATGPRGTTVTEDINAGIGDYISELNFATMIGGVARYDRFSVLTDFFYANASLTSSVSHLSTVNFGSGPIDIPRSDQLSTGTRLHETIWSLEGGYTLLDGAWGNLDAVAGFRMLNVGSTTDYTLASAITAPRSTITLSRNGSLDIGQTYFDGVGGVTGRINIPHSKFYIPFYLDAGSGGVPFTWEIYSGIAYSPASWVDVSAGYRYLSFQASGDSHVQNLSLGGAVIAANFRF